jgi:YHS domain-containing protein
MNSSQARRAPFWRSRSAQVIGLIALVAGAAAYWNSGRWRPLKPVIVHRHVPGSHGGTIVPVGHDHFHVEALFVEGGVLKLFTLGQDQTQVETVPTQKITAYVRTPQSTGAIALTLQSKPQPEDPPGQTSQFEGQLPLELVGSQLHVTVPSITIGEKRYRFDFLTRDDHAATMPQKVTSEAERQLYLTPAGKLTAADIKANGSQTPSQKYAGFMSAHDMHPVAGDAICPVTRTKANAKCSWIIDGKKYTFCCPPCIDEFVKLAKEHPEQIQDPREYAQK